MNSYVDLGEEYRCAHATSDIGHSAPVTDDLDPVAPAN